MGFETAPGDGMAGHNPKQEEDRPTSEIEDAGLRLAYGGAASGLSPGHVGGVRGCRVQRLVLGCRAPDPGVGLHAGQTPARGSSLGCEGAPSQPEIEDLGLRLECVTLDKRREGSLPGRPSFPRSNSRAAPIP